MTSMPKHLRGVQAQVHLSGEKKWDRSSSLKADFSPSKNKKEMTTMANTLAVTTSNAKGTPNENENLQVCRGANNEEVSRRGRETKSPCSPPL